MVVAHPRQDLADLITTWVPSTWRVIAAQRAIDAPTRTTIVVKQRSIKRTPQAPMGSRTIDFVLTLISRFRDPEKAEDDLDNTVPQFLAILDTQQGLSWETAEKVSVSDTMLGYDITITVNTKRETT